MDTRIYVMTHKEMAAIPNEIYIPLHVGRACGKELGYTGDHTGDHISSKNPYYCELTGIYWIWKNIKCDIVGVCHYRRFFTKEERLLQRSYIEETIRTYPVLIPNSSCVKERSVYEHYAKRHYAKDLDLCREVIQEKYPDYVSAFDYAMQTILISVGNMWITRKDIFDRYCAWLFDILFEVERRIDWTDYDDYQKRVIGFLSERLFRVWLFMQPEAVTEENVEMAEASSFTRADQRADLLDKYVRLKAEPVFSLYRLESHEPLAASMECGDDFNGKIPVWVCCLNDEGEMQEWIRCCKKSLRDNLPLDKMEIRWITLENCMQYVTFTESIVQKFNEGKISPSHLCELLWAELMFRYGGMWVDASCYMSRPPAPEIFEQEMYVLPFPEAMQKADAFQGQWSKSLWYAKKGEKLFQFLLEGLWYYWDIEDKLADVCLTDAFIRAAMREFPEIRRKMQRCTDGRETILGLHALMNRRYTPERMEKIVSGGTVYWTDWQGGYDTENIVGERTIYGHLCRQ